MRMRKNKVKKLQFSIKIEASKEKVWNILWDDKTFRDWANNIDEGMYLLGDLKKGNVVHFMSPTGYGVKSRIIKFIPNQLISFQHTEDTLEEQTRKKEWTGGVESYLLEENGGITTLTIETDVPPEQEETFNDRMPKALKRIKILSEERLWEK